MQETTTSSFPVGRGHSGGGRPNDAGPKNASPSTAWNASSTPRSATGSRGPGSGSTVSSATAAMRNDRASYFGCDDASSSFWECDVPVLSPLPKPLIFAARDKSALEQQQQQQQQKQQEELGIGIGDVDDATDELGVGQDKKEGKEEVKNTPQTSSPSSTTASARHLAAFAQQPIPPTTPGAGADMSTTYFAAEPLIETSENPKDPENVGWARSPTEVRGSRISPCRVLRALLVILGHVVLVWVVIVAVKGGRWRGAGRGNAQTGGGGALETHPHAVGSQQQSALLSDYPDHFHCEPKFVQSSLAEFEAPGSFEVREALKLHQGKHPHRYHHIAGHIHLLPGSHDQTPQVLVNTTVWTSWAQTLDHRIATKTTETGLQLQFVSSGSPPDSDGDDEGDDEEALCTFIRLDVAVKPSTTLSTLSVRSSHLSLAFHAGLAPDHLVVTNTTSVSLAAGSVSAEDASAVPPARNTTIELASGAIDGVYPLVDLLRLKTASGAIGVEVVPYTSSPLHAASSSALGSLSSSFSSNSPIPPAILDASTHAGALNIHLPSTTDAIPPRTYMTTARTASGDLGGRYLLGAQTTLQSDVGALRAAILPVYADTQTPIDAKGGQGQDEEEDYSHALRSSNAAGATELTVLSPVLLLSAPPSQSSSSSSSSPPPPPPLHIRASHTSRTGSLRATYPPAWRGSVCAAARIGRAAVGGEGVVVTLRERLGWVGERVCGVKGGQSDEEDGQEADVDVVMSVQAGNVEFGVQDAGDGGEGEGEEAEGPAGDGGEQGTGFDDDDDDDDDDVDAPEL
ncbi:uncharacterized protein BKA78DRAFT_290801 [Phyllosticta capitalensis]|uniref:Uncharacterized protein n=1 Tax=Phyllosticta capitalensis TaxID=121624 RepID=A0ABR1Z1G9_9PEZI